jgi:hypothetical protein
MKIEQLIWELNAKHYDQIRKSLQVVISPEDATMNPNLTANLRADRELRAKVEQQALTEVSENLKTALSWLENAHCLMNSNHLDKSHAQLYTAICDAVTACKEGLDHIDDQPDA